MSLPEVRKALGNIRAMWQQSGPNNPLFVCTILAGTTSIADFCTQFVYGHHLKRHHKSSQLKQLLQEPLPEPLPVPASTGMWWQQSPIGAGPDDDDFWPGACPKLSKNKKRARGATP